MAWAGLCWQEDGEYHQIVGDMLEPFYDSTAFLWHQKSRLSHTGMQHLSFNMKQKFPEESIHFSVAYLCGSSLFPGLPRVCKVKTESSLWTMSRSPPRKSTKELLKRSLVALLHQAFQLQWQQGEMQTCLGMGGNVEKEEPIHTLTLSTLNFVFFCGSTLSRCKASSSPILPGYAIAYSRATGCDIFFPSFHF